MGEDQTQLGGRRRVRLDRVARETRADGREQTARGTANGRTIAPGANPSIGTALSVERPQTCGQEAKDIRVRLKKKSRKVAERSQLKNPRNSLMHMDLNAKISR